MKCELLAEQNLALLHDFIDDESTKYDEAVLKTFLNEKNAYGYIAVHNEKAASIWCHMGDAPEGGSRFVIRVGRPTGPQNIFKLSFSWRPCISIRAIQIVSLYLC